MNKNNVILLLIFKGIMESLAHQNSTSNCTGLRNDFAIANANFTYCAIQHSRPITLCENCVDLYTDVVNSYADMAKEIINGTSCLDNFINLDRLEIVQSLYQNTLDLWKRGKCHECYVFENGQHTPEKSNETVQFLNYYNDFMKCIDIRINTSDADTLCDNCMNFYIDLRDYYSSISKYNEKIGLCMDLVDIMNTTWSFWSAKCCKYREHTEYTFIILNVFVLIIPVVFYLIAQFYVEKKDPTIIQQSRFAESLTISGNATTKNNK